MTEAGVVVEPLVGALSSKQVEWLWTIDGTFRVGWVVNSSSGGWIP